MNKIYTMVTLLACVSPIVVNAQTDFEKGELGGRVLVAASISDLYFERCNPNGIETNAKFDITAALLRDELNFPEKDINDSLPTIKAEAKKQLEKILNKNGGCDTKGTKYIMEVVSKDYKRTIKKIMGNF